MIKRIRSHAPKQYSHTPPTLSNKQLLLPIEIIGKIYAIAVQMENSSPEIIMQVDKYALNQMRRIIYKGLFFNSINKCFILEMVDFAEWSKETGLRYDLNEYIKKIAILSITEPLLDALTEFTCHSPLHLELLVFSFEDKLKSQKFQSRIESVRRVNIGPPFHNFLSESALDSVQEVSCHNDFNNLFEFANQCKNLKTLVISHFPNRVNSSQLAIKLESIRVHTKINQASGSCFSQFIRSAESLVVLTICFDFVEYKLGRNVFQYLNLHEVLQFPNLEVLCITFAFIDLSNLLSNITELQKLSRLYLSRIVVESITHQGTEELFSIALTGKPLVKITLDLRMHEFSKDKRLQISQDVTKGRDAALAKYTDEQKTKLWFSINDWDRY